MTDYHVILKKDKHALHAICYSRENAQKWIDQNGDSNHFDDKTLTKKSFKIKKVTK